MLIGHFTELYGRLSRPFYVKCKIHVYKYINQGQFINSVKLNFNIRLAKMYISWNCIIDVRTQNSEQIKNEFRFDYFNHLYQILRH